MKSTTTLVLTALIFWGACTTSEPIDFRQNLPIEVPPDAATAGAGQAGAPGQQGGGASGSGDQGGSAGIITAFGGMSGAVEDASTMPPDAGATDTPAAADAAADSATTDGGINATWTDIYNLLLDNPRYASNCTGAPCHNPGTQKGLDLSTQTKGYSTAKAKLVVGSPNSSKIITQLSSGAMPQGRPRMPAADLAVIKAWIMAGALNN